jgi:hypothetical protein
MCINKLMNSRTFRNLWGSFSIMITYICRVHACTFRALAGDPCGVPMWVL